MGPNRRVDNAAAGVELSLEEKIEEYLRRKNAKKRGMFNDEIDIEEYMKRKDAKKHGLFNDEIDIGVDYYEDFDDEYVEDRDNFFYDYYDFIANNDPGVHKGNHQITQKTIIHINHHNSYYHYHQHHQQQSVLFKYFLSSKATAILRQMAP